MSPLPASCVMLLCTDVPVDRSGCPRSKSGPVAGSRYADWGQAQIGASRDRFQTPLRRTFPRNGRGECPHGDERTWSGGFALRVLSRWIILLAGLLFVAACARTYSSSNHRPVHKRTSTATVVGRIDACQGIIRIGEHPAFTAGSVVVLRGTVTRKNAGHGIYESLLPKHVVERAQVKKASYFHFVLRPGNYVIEGHPLDVHLLPFVQVSLKRGTVTKANVPNECM